MNIRVTIPLFLGAMSMVVGTVIAVRQPAPSPSKAQIDVTERPAPCVGMSSGGLAERSLFAVETIRENFTDSGIRPFPEEALAYTDPSDPARPQLQWRTTPPGQLRNLLADRPLDAGLGFRAERAPALFLVPGMNAVDNCPLAGQRAGVLFVRRRVSIVQIESGSHTGLVSRQRIVTEEALVLLPFADRLEDDCG